MKLLFNYLLQIFLSTRWAILLNLHVEMFRVNKYPVYQCHNKWHLFWCYTSVWHEQNKLRLLMILLCQLVSLVRPFVVIVNLLHLQLVIHSASPVWVPWPEYSVEDILQVLIVFAVESLELDFALLFPERHILLRVLPILVVLATSSEKDSESLYKRVKINRLINIFKVINSYRDFQNSKGLRSYNDLSAKTSVYFFSLHQNDPVIPAFPDLHLSPAAIMKELSIYFQKFSTQTRLLSLPSPHELPSREAQEYPLLYLFIFISKFVIIIFKPLASLRCIRQTFCLLVQLKSMFLKLVLFATVVWNNTRPVGQFLHCYRSLIVPWLLVALSFIFARTFFSY